MVRPPQAGCCCPQATREQVGFSLLGWSACAPQLLVLHVRQVLQPVSRVWLTLTGIATLHPAPTATLSPPELTLGLRAPPTLLSTSSGGKNTITHISSPGTVTRLGGVTHVTTFSHASPGNRGGCNFKVSRSTFHQPHCSPPPELVKGVGGLSLLCSSITAHKDTEARESNGPQLVGDGAMSPRGISEVILPIC